MQWNEAQIKGPSNTNWWHHVLRWNFKNIFFSASVNITVSYIYEIILQKQNDFKLKDSGIIINFGVLQWK